MTFKLARLSFFEFSSPETDIGFVGGVRLICLRRMIPYGIDERREWSVEIHCSNLSFGISAFS